MVFLTGTYDAPGPSAPKYAGSGRERRRAVDLHHIRLALADFLKGLETGKPAKPDFRDALQTQAVCDAVLKSAKTGAWETVPGV